MGHFHTKFSDWNFLLISQIIKYCCVWLKQINLLLFFNSIKIAKCVVQCDTYIPHRFTITFWTGKANYWLPIFILHYGWFEFKMESWSMICFCIGLKFKECVFRYSVNLQSISNGNSLLTILFLFLYWIRGVLLHFYF